MVLALLSTGCSSVKVVEHSAIGPQCSFISNVTATGKSEAEVETDARSQAKAVGGDAVAINWATLEIQLLHGRGHKLIGNNLSALAKVYQCK